MMQFIIDNLAFLILLAYLVYFLVNNRIRTSQDYWETCTSKDPTIQAIADEVWHTKEKSNETDNRRPT